ncbi:hypothetical protein KGQ19_44200 [Catenulispora sp. NL8]|uniref:Integral membrane protein n=1 Tax=Catenulispora pinistramenti TaxID=2705254 RepID=A0ABS5L6B0_9ACTN|nr:hypothetical protein [Catenulispora pinistramenti]MBS2553878.1 hypothetical protein [Catenulispora pinistramenti]
MTARQDRALVLVQIGRPLALGLVKLGIGLALAAAGFLGIFVLASALGLVSLVWIAPLAVWLIWWACRLIPDGFSDATVRLLYGRVLPPRAMTIDRQGVRYSGEYAGAGAATGTFDIDVPWSGISDAGFRPGPGDYNWFCFDIQTDLPQPGPQLRQAVIDAGRAGMVVQIEQNWIAAEVGDDSTVAERRIMSNMFWFGTPLAVNLGTCRRARPARIDAALRRWAPTGLRCDSQEPEWWHPPLLDRLLH